VCLATGVVATIAGLSDVFAQQMNGRSQFRHLDIDIQGREAARVRGDQKPNSMRVVVRLGDVGHYEGEDDGRMWVRRGFPGLAEFSGSQAVGFDLANPRKKGSIGHVVSPYLDFPGRWARKGCEG
jgi:hypothetical protein